MKKTHSTKLILLVRPSTLTYRIEKIFIRNSSLMSELDDDLTLFWFYDSEDLYGIPTPQSIAYDLSHTLRLLLSLNDPAQCEYYVVHLDHLRNSLSCTNKHLQYLIKRQPIERPIFIDQIVRNEPLTFSPID